MRIVEAAEAVAQIRSGQSIYVHGASATPEVLLAALVARAPELEDVRVIHLHIEGPGPHLAPEMAGHFRHLALFIGPNARKAINKGRAEYIPAFLSDVPHLFRRRILPWTRCSSTSRRPTSTASAPWARPWKGRSPRSNRRTRSSRSSTGACRGPWAMPSCTSPRSTSGWRWTSRRTSTRCPRSASWSGASAATWRSWYRTVRCSRWASAPSRRPWAWTRNKKDLGIHTEMFTDVLVELVESGAVTGRRKEINRGKIVTGFMMGTQRLYDFVDDNPMVEMRPVDYTNDTAVIRRLRRMTAINSAIEIDLTGQVCADPSVPGCTPASAARWTSCVARRWRRMGGRSSRCRRPRWMAGRRASCRSSSRVPAWSPSRGHVQTVVTEYGVAELHGRSVAQRARALIAIAHPDFRDELTAAAKEIHFL